MAEGDAQHSRILAHRGLWDSEESQNSPSVLKRALNFGFGFETDIYQFEHGVFIAHDSKSGIKGTFDDLYSLISSSPSSSRIALNVKSDGIDAVLLKALSAPNVFFFDMSTTEQIRYLRMGLAVADRISEFDRISEQRIHEFGAPKRVWVDSLVGHWWELQDLREMTTSCAEIFIVSDELHGRNPTPTWRATREMFSRGLDVFLCTDFPIKAAEEVFS